MLPGTSPEAPQGPLLFTVFGNVQWCLSWEEHLCLIPRVAAGWGWTKVKETFRGKSKLHVYPVLCLLALPPSMENSRAPPHCAGWPAVHT